MYIYVVKSGRAYHNDEFLTTGYSGFGPSKNDPLAVNRAGLGPIPPGAYSVGPERDSLEHGPIAMHLIPLTGTETFGRSGFMVHGDSIEHPGGASHGCIILPRPVRERIADNPDKLLVVLSGNV